MPSVLCPMSSFCPVAVKILHTCTQGFSFSFFFSWFPRLWINLTAQEAAQKSLVNHPFPGTLRPQLWTKRKNQADILCVSRAQPSWNHASMSPHISLGLFEVILLTSIKGPTISSLLKALWGPELLSLRNEVNQRRLYWCQMRNLYFCSWPDPCSFILRSQIYSESLSVVIPSMAAYLRIPGTDADNSQLLCLWYWVQTPWPCHPVLPWPSTCKRQKEEQREKGAAWSQSS